jgi:thiol-disulfide isomerase/thioredoxin
MKLRLSLLSLLVLVALVVAACGGATPAPDVAMDQGDSAAVMEKDNSAASSMDDSAMMANDTDASMDKNDSSAMMEEDNSDSMMHQDDAGVMKENDSAMMADDAETSMDKDNSGAMMAEDNSDSIMHQDDTGTMQEDTSGASMEQNSDTVMAEEAMIEVPGWFNAALTNVNTGQTFTVADLKGKVVLVETMAIWCSNCLRQQKEVKALHDAMGMNEDFVTVVLDIDPNENAENLQAYTARNGFDWTYAVAPRDVAREIGQTYGDQFLNPPSTPMLIIDRHGEVHPLPFGIKKSDSLQQALEPFLNDAM